MEMHTGMVLFGAVCQLVGAFIVKNQLRYAGSLWFGILFAVAGSLHMARTLDRALAEGADTSRIIVGGYVFRYLMIAAVLALVALTGVLDTLIVFLGYMSMKVTAYLQPLTHKIYNMLFHETDPVSAELSEGEEGETEKVSREDEGLPK